jgi:competence protein ComEC
LDTHARGDLTAATLSTSEPPVLVGDPPWWQTAAGGIRAGLHARVPRCHTCPAVCCRDLSWATQASSILELAQRFREVGTDPSRGVSGSNVALIVGCVVLLARWARLRPQWTAAVAAACLVGLVILVRPSPSVLRAAVMGGVGLLALASGRGRAALPALSRGDHRAAGSRSGARRRRRVRAVGARDRGTAPAGAADV